ncbi:MAG: DNA methyltransferase [Gallionella sp.]|nr:DNA methyltransferase [Gallionella sp.]
MRIEEAGPALLINADCRDAMRAMDADSVDAVVTDPPYGLNFMSKGWDHGVPGKEFWVEALRVAKPGAHLLAFGGTRTFHRLMVAIEDAGWEIRDTIMWVYGCLSEDTEMLTRDGWERYHVARTKEILAYDPQTDVYQWENPERWSEYRVEQDTAYHIESDTTDQIVSRNHRCLVERSGILAFVAAEECAGVEYVPYLQGDLSALSQGRGALLFEEVQRQGEGLAETALGERQGQEVPRQGDGWPEEPGMEGRADLLQTEGQVREPVHQVRSLSCSVHGHGPQGWLRHGASPDCGDGDGATAVAQRVCTSHQPRRDGQPAGEPDAVCVERRPQAVRTRPSYQTTLATVTPIEYTGLIFCPTVSTGAFVARRNGKVFLTGNSGFPKSLDVSKAIDKAAGVEREAVGINPRAAQQTPKNDATSLGKFAGTSADLTAPATEAAKQWEGWGTALKPAFEPVIVARKPLIGTVAANVQQHGTGAINIDGCRVEGRERTEYGLATAQRTQGSTFGEPSTDADFDSSKGRWPANFCHDGSDEVLALFPDSNGSGGSLPQVKITGYGDGAVGTGKSEYFGGPRTPHDSGSGSAARFFYCAKTSKKDRNEGMDAEPNKILARSCQAAAEAARGNTVAAEGGAFNKAREVKNNHPTVKPTELMRYLCRLVTPPGGTVLDPFMGSGSTGKAALKEGFGFVGIDSDEEHGYFDIALARIRSAVE